MNYTVGPVTYFKIFFHAARHPHLQVNGVLLGKSTSGTVEIVDAVPLLHHWTSLSPMMEIGLDLAGKHAEELGLSLVGYYQACESLDTALVPVGEKVASKIKEGFGDAVALVIDGDKIGSPDHAALIPYVAQTPSSSWRPFDAGTVKPFTAGSSFSLTSPTFRLLHRKFGDFDDHLEDVTIDWLRNRAALPEDLQPSLVA
ncbi:hypothetical protein BDP27DRAFT_1472164 [Rhodocollybia butyracea]|uniref:MPN domain-containing protein n=1 Tax=Rhodocollybia butyracea TaxID=206335 RepID=A0A9P5U3B0_9AGAR|nr:hypothetical protein BDP27DRAFT_1472164 [Rhodocollybia butyracea]